MPTYRDEGIVLRTHKLGEADRIVTFLTRSHGKVRAVAKGIRRTNSKFGGRLEPFSHVDVQFAQGRNLDTVAQAEQIHAYGEPLMQNYAAYTAGVVMLECADKLAFAESEPNLMQYRLLLGAIRTLGFGTPLGMRPPTMVLDAYLLRSMATAGYAPSLSVCAVCGAAGPHQAFHAVMGGMVCLRCRPPACTRPKNETVVLMSKLLTGQWEGTDAVDLEIQAEASQLTSAFVNWHLEHRLRALPLVEREAQSQYCPN